MGLATKYAKAVWETEAALATWLPDRQVAVGDILVQDKRSGAITVETNIGNLLDTKNFDQDIVRRAGAPELNLHRGVSFDSNTDAGVAGAEVRVRFDGKSSFLLAAKQGRIAEYRQIAEVRKAIRGLWNDDRWDLSWQLVTAVRSFAACTLIIAHDRGVEAEARIDPSAPVMDIAGVHAGASVTVRCGTASDWTLRQSTPLYESLVIRKRILRDTEIASGGYLEATNPRTGSDQSPALDSSVDVVRCTPWDLDIPSTD
jgi:hypothetical protein